MLSAKRSTLREGARWRQLLGSRCHKSSAETSSGFGFVASNWRRNMSDTNPITGIEDGHALAQAIVDTIREPLLVLDKDLHVVAASRSFYLMFKANRQEVQGLPIYSLGNGQWNIPELR